MIKNCDEVILVYCMIQTYAMCTAVTPSLLLVRQPVTLHDTDIRDMYGCWAFSIAGPATWNSLIDSLPNLSLAIDTFHSQLITFLFQIRLCVFSAFEILLPMRYITVRFPFLYFTDTEWITKTTSKNCWFLCTRFLTPAETWIWNFVCERYTYCAAWRPCPSIFYSKNVQ